MPDALILLVLPVAVAAILAFKWWRNRIPSGWIIGPIIGGKNHSADMPLRPTITPGGWRMAVTGEPHYVTRTGAVKGGITGRYRVTGAFAPVEHPDMPAVMSLHFQLRDDWKDPARRWYSLETFPLTEGEHSFAVPLEAGAWINVNGQTEGFATDHMTRFGLVFGSPWGRGHGIRGAGSIELLEWNA